MLKKLMKFALKNSGLFLAISGDANRLRHEDGVTYVGKISSSCHPVFMTGSIKNRIQRIISLFLIFFLIQSLSYKALAEDFVSTGEIVKTIEKTLLFDKESREKINFYKKKKSQKSDISIVRPEKSANLSGEENRDRLQIVSVDPKLKNFDAREKEKIAYNTALIGQYEVAIELYKQVLAVEPDNNYCKFSLAVVYQKIGQLRQAKIIYYKLLKNNPANQEEIVGNLLAILVEESPKDAVYLLSRLTMENPNSPYILAQAAVAYDQLKNYDQAINLLGKAVVLDPGNIEYKYNLAVIYDKTNQYEKALEIYSDVVKNFSDSNQSIAVDQVRKRIESIKGKL